jgi:hydrogenase nickel incorporation protein HypA/HybF
MHELAVAMGIVERVAEATLGRRVCRVTVEIGDRVCISHDALRFSFGLAAEGTPADGADLEIRTVNGDALNVRSLEVEEPA